MYIVEELSIDRLLTVCQYFHYSQNTKRFQQVTMDLLNHELFYQNEHAMLGYAWLLFDLNLFKSCIFWFKKCIKLHKTLINYLSFETKIIKNANNELANIFFLCIY